MVSRRQWALIIAGIVIATLVVLTASPNSYARALLSGQCDKRPAPEQCNVTIGLRSVGWGGTTRPIPIAPQPKR
jgi:hypothetical protein